MLVVESAIRTFAGHSAVGAHKGLRNKMNSLEGTGPKCRLGYYGALNSQFNQFCVKCGSALEIREGGVLVSSRVRSDLAIPKERIS